MYSHFMGEKILLCQRRWFSGSLSALRTNTRHRSCLLKNQLSKFYTK